MRGREREDGRERENERERKTQTEEKYIENHTDRSGNQKWKQDAIEPLIKKRQTERIARSRSLCNINAQMNRCTAL